MVRMRTADGLRDVAVQLQNQLQASMPHRPESDDSSDGLGALSEDECANLGVMKARTMPGKNASNMNSQKSSRRPSQSMDLGKPGSTTSSRHHSRQSTKEFKYSHSGPNSPQKGFSRQASTLSSDGGNNPRNIEAEVEQLAAGLSERIKVAQGKHSAATSTAHTHTGQIRRDMGLDSGKNETRRTSGGRLGAVGE